MYLWLHDALETYYRLLQHKVPICQSSESREKNSLKMVKGEEKSLVQSCFNTKFLQNISYVPQYLRMNLDFM